MRRWRWKQTVIGQEYRSDTKVFVIVKTLLQSSNNWRSACGDGKPRASSAPQDTCAESCGDHRFTL